jgi:hypothetical protein
MDGVNAFDRAKDAWSCQSRRPKVTHAPCRTWSKYLAAQARPADYERERALAEFCLACVRACGGVFEHPAESTFWKHAKLPAVGDMSDPFEYTLYIEQAWFGYPTRKPTWLLVCGVPFASLRPVPYTLAQPVPSHQVGTSFQRARTTARLAEWLCQTARCSWWQHKR